MSSLMEFFETVEKRQSIRKFKSTPISEELLQKLLNATNRAPSAGNFQSFEVFVVQTPEKLQALAKATYDQNFMLQAPLSLVFCANPSRCEYQPSALYSMEDATIACTFAMMAATALGLSSCWIGAFKPEAVAAAIGAPRGLMPIAILPIGYPDETPERTTRRQLSELVRRI